MTIKYIFSDPAKKLLSMKTFYQERETEWDQDVRPEILELMRQTNEPIPHCLLPYKVKMPMEVLIPGSGVKCRIKNSFDTVPRYFEWLKDNTRDAWMPWVEIDTYYFLFANDIDAFGFQMYVEIP